TGSISSFSASKVWALSHNEEPLPIQLIHFNAECAGKQVDINWSTLTETNNSMFTIQRSADANTFIDIASLPGAGNSNTQLNYAATDDSPLHSLAYYRLKQTDFDGNYTISEVVAVENCNTEAPSCQTYYDPAKGAVTVDFQGEETQPFTVSMFDMMGQQLIPETSKQLGRTDLDVGFLAYGVYLVVVRTEKDIFSTKVYLNR
ncbi:MAG: T9SS type A sorting domain-containing protein, partial [Bacteroidota bacterium]